MGVLSADIGQGVEGVGDARTVDVVKRNGEIGGGCGGDRGRQITLFGVGDVFFQL